MLQGVVSNLDHEHGEQVESLWRELEREFGLKDAANAYPHFSYQVVERYDTERTKGVLRRFANKAEPFTIRTSGLGLFTGESPTLYITVARSVQLTNFHARLWKRLSKSAQEIHDHHYGPDNFIPHITLAAGDLLPDHLPDVIRLFGARPFNWDMHVDNLALVPDAQGTRDQWIRYPFGGSAV
jgi:2'-5' RNA ligase